ncbi:MAG TPA: response regulator [Vicinamibacteria bacterium]|jgi:CheY-like chemotaxis protein|nr:response regulator [Vicinamibacteria bacterium]
MVAADTLLVVDDDREVLEMLALRLRAAGLHVDTAPSGFRALERLRVAPPQIIVCDVRMPGMSGYDLCRLIRNLGHDDIPFIFYSVMGSRPERLAGLRVGADDYVAKVPDPEELVLKVKAQLQRRRRLLTLQQDTMAGPRLMRGSLGEITAVDLVQVVDLLGLGGIWIRVESARLGRSQIHVNDDREVVHASAGALQGAKAFFRILASTEGEFSIDRAPFEGVPQSLGSLAKCLLEGVAHIDEYRQIQTLLRSLGGSYDLHTPDLGSCGIRIDQIRHLVETYHDLDVVLNLSTLTDLESARIVLELFQAGVITPRTGGVSTPGAKATRAPETLP